MSPVRLRAEAIEKRYGRVAALRGLDFELGPGESLALLGANGAGKSSLLKILAGLSRPSRGQLVARLGGGQEGAGANASAPLDRAGLRARVGYVGHATLLYGELTARENLSFAARLHGQSPQTDTLDALLADFALLDVADRRAGTFSRGMAQRLAIARAIVHAPSLILLDEPFTGLDELSAERLSERLATLRGNADAPGPSPSRSIVVVTHDPRRAVELADRALLLHAGRIEATATRSEGQAFTAEALRNALAELARGAASPDAALGDLA